MDARRVFYSIFFLTLISSPHLLWAQMYQVDSENFSIRAPDIQLAKKAAQLAEQYRSNLSKEWLGYEIAKWGERCPVTIQIDAHAGGETSFGFVGGSHDGTVKATPIGWQMKIFGPPDRVLDAVLPHEITHTIFATHFGRPLPRWADEGACTTVEHESERAKNHQLLLRFLKSRPSRGIPFNRMFTMKQYPHDILPLYAQGFSVAKFLIRAKGKRHFVKYLGAGLDLERPHATTRGWDRVTNEYYGYENLSELYIAWIDWVAKGSPEKRGLETPAIAQVGHDSQMPSETLASRVDSYDVQNQNSWYAQQMGNGTASKDTSQITLSNSVSALNPAEQFQPGSINIPEFRTPNLPARQSSTMSAKDSGTIWR